MVIFNLIYFKAYSIGVVDNHHYVKQKEWIPQNIQQKICPMALMEKTLIESVKCENGRTKGDCWINDNLFEKSWLCSIYQIANNI